MHTRRRVNSWYDPDSQGGRRRSLDICEDDEEHETTRYLPRLRRSYQHNHLPEPPRHVEQSHIRNMRENLDYFENLDPPDGDPCPPNHRRDGVWSEQEEDDAGGRRPQSYNASDQEQHVATRHRDARWEEQEEQEAWRRRVSLHRSGSMTDRFALDDRDDDPAYQMASRQREEDEPGEEAPDYTYSPAKYTAIWSDTSSPSQRIGRNVRNGREIPAFDERYLSPSPPSTTYIDDYHADAPQYDMHAVEWEDRCGRQGARRQPASSTYDECVLDHTDDTFEVQRPRNIYESYGEGTCIKGSSQVVGSRLSPSGSLPPSTGSPPMRHQSTRSAVNLDHRGSRLVSPEGDIRARRERPVRQISLPPSRPRHDRSDHQPDRDTRRGLDRTYQPPKEVESSALPAYEADPLGMSSLRSIVMIPEAKANPHKKRQIGPGESARAIVDFFVDEPGRKPTPELPVVRRKRSPVFEPEQVESSAPKVDWRNDKSIQNPEWYIGATSPPSSNSTARKSLPIFVGGTVIQQRQLYRSLEKYGFDMVEREGLIQSADLVVSPKTAIIFHPFATLVQAKGALLHRVKRAAVYFPRTIVVLEVISYRLLAKDPEVEVENSPLTPDLVTCLGSFKRALALSVQPGEESVIGVAEAIFVVNGSDEVARAIRHLAEQDDLRVSARCNPLVREVWDNHNWAQQEFDPEDEESLVDAGFNLFSTRFVLSLVDTYAFFAEHLARNERVNLVGAVVGADVVERFNKLYEEGCERDQSESTLATSKSQWEKAET